MDFSETYSNLSSAPKNNLKVMMKEKLNALLIPKAIMIKDIKGNNEYQNLRKYNGRIIELLQQPTNIDMEYQVLGSLKEDNHALVRNNDNVSSTHLFEYSFLEEEAGSIKNQNILPEDKHGEKGCKYKHEDTKFSVDIKEHNLNGNVNFLLESPYGDFAVEDNEGEVKKTLLLGNPKHKGSIISKKEDKDERQTEGEEEKNDTEDKCESETEACKIDSHIKHIGIQKCKKNYRCELCSSRFSCLHNLKQHINVKHKGRDHYGCELCNKTFTRIYNVNSHVNSVHKGVRNYECVQCFKRFNRLKNLQTHIKFVHRKERVKQFECVDCLKRFSRFLSLDNHINTIHKQLKKYKCEHCAKAFSQLSFCKRHIHSVHMKIRKFKCNDCCKNFCDLKNLKCHINSIHKGIKLFMCEKCGKRFSILGNLNIHISAVHEKFKTHVCDKCNRKFSMLQKLQRHIYSVHKGFSN